MSKKPFQFKSKPSTTFEFVSPLHMDIAMTRLNSWLEKEFSPLHESYPFRVESQKLHDSHYFEVRQRGNNLLPKRVVTGSIRQLDEHRSLVRCEVKTVGRYLIGFEVSVLALVFLTAFTLFSGEAITINVLSLWALVAVAAVAVRWWRRKLRQRPDPILERIQRALEK